MRVSASYIKVTMIRMLKGKRAEYSECGYARPVCKPKDASICALPDACLDGVQRIWRWPCWSVIESDVFVWIAG